MLNDVYDPNNDYDYSDSEPDDCAYYDIDADFGGDESSYESWYESFDR